MDLVDKSKFLRLGGLLLVLVVALWFKFFSGSSEQHRDEIQERFVATNPSRGNADQIEESKPSGTDEIGRYPWTAPASNWLNTEKNRAASTLSAVDVTLLVLPIQSDVNAFDTIERSLMSRLISDRIAQDDDNTVANPTSVLRYLGTHRSTYPMDEIVALAKLTNADKILSIRTEHDRQGRWQLKASLHDSEYREMSAAEGWAELSYSDIEPASASFETILDDVVKFATGHSIKRTQKKAKFDPNSFQFPNSIDDLTDAAKKSPLHAAAYLQLIGMLHPRGSFNEVRNHLFERSLVELQNVSPSVPYYRYFSARAYAYLGRRPAALEVLGDPTNEHESALMEALNGNLPDLRILAEEMGTSALDYMTWKDLQEIEYRYQAPIESDTLERFTEAHPVWAPFIQRSLRDYDKWANYSSAAIKLGLEELVPTEVVSLENEVAKLVVTRDVPSELDLMRLVWRHIEAAEKEELLSRASESRELSKLSAQDVLDLAKTTAVANHLREVEEDLAKRVLPKAALEEISEFDSLFSGHPAVTLLKGRAMEAMAEDSVGSEKVSLIQRSADTLLNGYTWTGYLTADAITVVREYNKYLRASSRGDEIGLQRGYTTHYSPRYHEWPQSHDWYKSISSREVPGGVLKRCVDYMWTSFWCLRHHIDNLSKESDAPDQVRSELLAANAHRFAGDPARDRYEVKIARTSSDEYSEVRLLESKINAGITDWTMYYALGREYKRRGDYEEAQKAWLSYPGIQARNRQGSLAETEYADVTGASLFWIGQHELALPLLEIAASSRKGSGNAMSSAARVALIKGDLQGAEEWSAERVRRYRSKHGLRDFLQILHIRGQSDLAWRVFDQVQATKQDSQMWSGALVGHRMASATTADIAEWIQASKSRKTAAVTESGGYGSIDLAPRYLLMAGAMDRAPGPELARIVSAAHTQKPRYQHHVKRDRTESGLNKTLLANVRTQNRLYEHDELIPTPQDERHIENNQEVENRFAMLADAMSAFSNEDYDESFERFNETAYYYELDEYLPYYAFSAAVVGSAKHLPSALSAREADLNEVRLKEGVGSSALGYRFDEDLTYAVLASFEGRHEEAIQYLENALNNRPFIEDRSVYPMYQIVDLADRLYERTGEEPYRKLALDLSRRHTVILPMYSWAYFVVAKYSQSSVERVSAAASGLKLDPLSHRGSLLPKKLLSEATNVLGKHGAPYLRRTKDTVNLGA